MENSKNTNTKRIVIIICVALFAVCLGMFAGMAVANSQAQKTVYVEKEKGHYEASGNIATTDKQIKIQVPAQKIKYEMLDSHLHYLDFIQQSDGFSALTTAMDLSGVKDAIIFGMPMAKQWDDTMENAPTYYLDNDSRCYYYPATDYILAEELLCQPKEVQDRFYPFICGVNTNDRYAAEHIRQLLESYPDFWCGIGEIMSRHDDLTALTYGEAPHVNSETFKAIFDLGAEYDLPVLVHHNITGQSMDDVIYLDEMKEALAYNRDCKIIWAHMGLSRRVNVDNLSEIMDEMLADNDNLYVDISWVVFDDYYLEGDIDRVKDPERLNKLVNIVNKYPDRILIGTDKVGHWETYPKDILKYYILLDRLSPEVAQKICRDNALSLIRKK